jgi:alpha-D-xyloside xylohydrolase
MRKLLTIALLLAGITCQAQDVKIEFITPSIVHVVKGQPTKTLVITAQPQNVAVTQKGNTWTSSELTVKLNPEIQSLTFMTNKGKVLLKEEGWSLIRKTIDEWEVSQTFQLDKDEAIYGLGTIQNGKMNRRGEKKRMEQSNLEDFQNVLQSIKGWGIYWENYSPTLFEDNAQGMTFTSEAGQGVDYYFMYGGSADGVIAQMRYLTGDVPMFPLWTYGYWQSKERYKTAAETEGIVDQYRALQVPLDGIIQDWQYWGSNYLWNAMDFLSEDFSNGKQMIDNVHAKHAHFMISIWASFGPQTQQFRELNEKGLLLPFETWPQSGISHIWPPRMDYPSGVKVYDAFSPEARAIYWKHLKRLYDYGTDAWWMDSTDPDFFNPRESDYAHKVYGGTWRSQRNAFPLETVRGIYEAQRSLTPDPSPKGEGSKYSQDGKAADKVTTPLSPWRGAGGEAKRVFIMTRSSFAGQQHYGSNMWSGDVNSSWDMLRKQVPAGLSFSLTGNPNFNTDIGGFFCNAYNTQGPASAPRNPQFQELYVRWMQYGLFCPVFRSHGADAPREIWQFGKKGEPVYDAIEKMIRLRYRLIPYLYSTAWQVTTNNDSYQRPLFSDFASDKKVWNMTDEFMFGRSILAAPIVDPQYTEEKIVRTDAMTGWDRENDKIEKLKNGSNNQLQSFNSSIFQSSKTATKYLPKGTAWYDFWTNKRYQGGQTVTLTTTLDRVPMFVRAGSILPLGPEMQYVGEKSWDNLEIRVYPGADGQFTLYEDEGDNYNYEKGMYSVIRFAWNDKTHTLTIGERQGSYPGMLSERAFTVVWPDGTTKTVNYNGSEVRIDN